MMTAKSDPEMARKNHRLKKVISIEACIPEVGYGPVETSHDGRGTELLVPEKARSEAMSPEEMVEAITDELFNRIDSAPWGTRSRIQRKAEVNKNYFNSWKDPERVRLLPLAHALDFLGIEPAEFFSTVFNQGSSQVAEPWPLGREARAQLEALAKSLESTSEPVDFFAAVTPPRPAGLPPSGVKKALERMATPPSQAEESSLGIEIEGIIDQQELTRLDEFRWDNPLQANKILERAISDSPMELLAEILLVYGTTFRQLDQLGNAKWAYFTGEMRAKETGDRKTFAATLQRRSWVEFAEGRFSNSLDLLRRAAGTFAELGDSNREAKVLVSMARQYADLEKAEEAVICADSALQQLDRDEKHHRFTAHQVSALAYSGLGDTAAMLQNLEAAETLLKHCPKGAKVRFVWLEAKLKKELLPPEIAASIFEEAASFFAETGEIQASALAMLEFVGCLAELGEHHELMEANDALKGFAFKVDDGREPGRLSAAALMKVYRAILKSAVSESLQSSVAQAIQEAAGALKAPAGVEI